MPRLDVLEPEGGLEGLGLFADIGPERVEQGQGVQPLARHRAIRQPRAQGGY